MSLYPLKKRSIWGALCLLLTISPALAETVTEQGKPSLYTRLGGLAPISVVVSDFIDALVPDAILNANPAIDAAGNLPNY